MLSLVIPPPCIFLRVWSIIININHHDWNILPAEGMTIDYYRKDYHHHKHSNNNNNMPWSKLLLHRITHHNLRSRWSIFPSMGI
mmetsp:Transcript_113298/g.327250  ORF Transcript_113298/g.327250 Transcript_113298/m.327250 type:complete len:84 (-) Transcript_113298:13-264(-)